MKIKICKWISILSVVLMGAASLSANESKAILMLVTGADKMSNGRPTGLWLEEFAIPYKMFVDAGYSIEIVTPEGGAAPIDSRSRPDPEKAAVWERVIKLLDETEPLTTVTAEKFAAIFIPGGHGAMFDLVEDPAVTKLIEQFYAQGKPIASICHGPVALVNVMREDGTPLVEGKTMTAFSDAEENSLKLAEEMPFLLESKLRELGAKVETKDNFVAHAVRDGNLITGQNPASSQATAELLIEALSADNK